MYLLLLTIADLKGTYHILLTQIQRKVLGYDCSILQKNLVDSLQGGRQYYNYNLFAVLLLKHWNILRTVTTQ